MMALSQPDEGLGFPSGTTLIPRIFLRNAGPGPAKVSLTVDWRGESASGEFAPPQLMLSPGEERTIDLSSQQKSTIPADANWATVKLDYSGRRADLVEVALSYDKDNRYGLQTPFSESVSRMWAGGMWHVDPTHNTFITTGNAGSESTAAEATLFYNGGKSRYRVEKMLSPGQQLWLDVGHLIRDQVPDSDGHTLPPDTMAGSYELRDLDHATVGFLYEGKLIIDKTYGHASYGCANCCGYTLATLIPDPFDGPPQISYDDVLESTEQCGGQVVDVTGSGFNWTSSDPSIATLPNRTLHTIAVGSATGSAEVTLRWTHPAPLCPTITSEPQQPVTVQVPTSLKVVSATILQMGNSGNHGCTLGYYGIALDVDYQVLDQNSSPIQSSSMTPQEYIVWYDGTNNGGFKNIGPTYVSTTSMTTRTDGTFDDAPVELCKAVPFTTPLTSTQTIQVLFNNKAYNVRTNNWKFSSTKVTNHGTITNGSDVNKTQ
jgi:hypothetical protein